MPDYYVDCSNGNGADSAGRGTTKSDPYLTIQYALDDILATHGKDSTQGDTIKVIGTSSVSGVTFNSSGYGTHCAIVSDGLAAFGTAATSRAVLDASNNSGVITNNTAGNQSYLYLSGFKITGMVSNVTPITVWQNCTIDNFYADWVAEGITSYPKFLSQRTDTKTSNCYFKAKINASGSGGSIISSYTGCEVHNNFCDFEDERAVGAFLRLHLMNSNADNVHSGNTFWLKGVAQACSTNSTTVRFINNTVVGSDPLFLGSVGFVFWVSGDGAVISGNHFENCLQGVGYNSDGSQTSKNVLLQGNTFFNCTNQYENPTSTRIAYFILRNNTTMTESGVINASIGDLRSSGARAGLGLGVKEDFPVPATGATTGANCVVPNIYNPFEGRI